MSLPRHLDQSSAAAAAATTTLTGNDNSTTTTTTNDNDSIFVRQQEIEQMRARVEYQLQAMLTGTNKDFTTIRKQVEQLKTPRNDITWKNNSTSQMNQYQQQQ